MFCLLNGEVKELHTTGLPLTDLGIVRGYGYFDYLRTYNGKPFLLDEHLERLKKTSSLLYLPVPYSNSQIKEWISILLERNKFTESHIKIVVTGGPSDDGISVEKPSFFILNTSLTPYPESYYQQGIRVILYEHLRLFPEAKSLNYLTALFLREERKKHNALEVVFTYNGQILEAATSNIFLFKNKKLITPIHNILNGITRQVIIRLAKKHWLVEERDVTHDEFQSADEIFITASNKEVMPVVYVNDHAIGNGIVGAQTQKLHTLYKSFIQTTITM